MVHIYFKFVFKTLGLKTQLYFVLTMTKQKKGAYLTQSYLSFNATVDNCILFLNARKNTSSLVALK